jgi:peptidyl-prolyl cis-trans isomerase C
MASFLREPLLHFSLLGAALFVLYLGIGQPEESAKNIRVSASTIEALAHGFQSVWDRPPSRSELDQLIAEYTKEEIYYRAAVEAGLDRDDPVVRRRLRQKMEFLTSEPVREEKPGDPELEKFIARHAERYRESDGAMPPVASVRERAIRDWLAERRQLASDAFYEKLRKEYSVQIESRDGP